MNNFSSTPATDNANSSRATLSALATTGLTALEAEIFASIHGAIVEQRLLPGTRLTEEELSAIYSISRMHIRRILLALAHTGTISLPPGKGALVARPSADEARAVFSARRLIEVRLLEAPEIIPAAKTLKELQQLVQREGEAARNLDRVAMIQLSGAFHVDLARSYGNPVIAEIVGSLITRSSLIIALYQNSATTCCRHDDHVRLLAILAKKDWKRAGSLMRGHLDAIEAGLNLNTVSGGTQDLRGILAPR